MRVWALLHFWCSMGRAVAIDQLNGYENACLFSSKRRERKRSVQLVVVVCADAGPQRNLDWQVVEFGVRREWHGGYAIGPAQGVRLSLTRRLRCPL